MDIWQRMSKVAQQARNNGQLLSIANSFEVIEDGGIPFVVRFAPSLVEKIRATKTQGQKNPFLPPEPSLWVEAVGGQHNLVLNKFNVLDRHGLITTQHFVEQTDQLSLADFTALSDVLDESNGLLFYNGGEQAGASQRHRHFQLVPKDMGAGVLPIEQLIDACHHHEHAQIFPFEHRLYWLPDVKPETLFDAWQKLEFSWQPYNLLLTRQWMLVVPRSKESAGSMSINALAFAGALLAKNEQELEVIKAQGPLSLLCQVTCKLS